MPGQKKRHVSPMVINRILAAINFRPRMTCGEIEKALDLDEIRKEVSLLLERGYIMRTYDKGVNRYSLDERGVAYVMRCQKNGAKLSRCLRPEDQVRLIQGTA